MKCFLSLIFVVVSMLLTLKSEPSLTANDLATASTNQPIKVLDVKLGATNSQSQKDRWPGGLEIQIENISGKPIQYLVIYAEVPAGKAAEDRVRMPLTYGQLFADSKSGKVEVFQPGARLTLRASKIECERIRQLVASGFVPSSKEIQPNLHVVLFADRTSWLAGRLHYPDPANANKWIAAEELARSETPASDPFGMSFLKASLKPISKTQTCYRYTGFYLEFCCINSQDSEIYLANANLVEDPTGHVHPITQYPCCPQTSNCCSQVWYASGCEQ